MTALLVAALWLCAQRGTRDHRVPPLRLVRCERPHLARGLR